jgi:hypothetical protein
MNNPFALVVIVAQQEVLCQKLDDQHRQTTRMKIVAAMKASGNFNEVQIKEFVLFLNRIIIVTDLNYNAIFDQQVSDLTRGAITMGITETLKMLDREEGIEIGEAKKSHHVVENLIIKLGLSDEQAADVAEVSVDFVKNIRQEIAARK